MSDPTPPTVPSTKTTLQVTFDWRLVVAVLLVIIGAMLVMWKPWQAAAPAKTVTVRGEATIKGVPDEFQFQPYYEDADIQKATAAGNDAVAKLKALGVADADIKTTVQSADNQGKPEPASNSSSI